MIVITMTDCPAKLRGDLSKWMFEINTGVYVGQLSARVREALWKRVCENIKDGRATMVYNYAGDQHFEFRVHNTTWKIRDYDGIKLMMRPKKTNQTADKLPKGYSKASKRLIASRNKKRTFVGNDDLIFLDIETTGLDFRSDKIIEIGALVVKQNEIITSWSTFVKIEETIPYEISNLTKITDEMLDSGMDLKNALETLAELIKGRTVVCFNKKFDILFLQFAFSQSGLENPIEKVIDVLIIARKQISNIQNYQLGTIAEYYNISYGVQHRALADCRILYQVFLKLNEK